MSKKTKQYKIVIGLIHPSCSWHNESKTLRGEIIEVIDIYKHSRFPSWYTASVKLINPPSNGFEVIANNMCIHGFRPRRILVK